MRRELADVVARLRDATIGRGADPQRPFVVANVPLGGSGEAPLADAVTLLHENVDAVMQGPGPLRFRRAHHPPDAFEFAERRVARGLAPQPLIVIIAASADMPLANPVFDDGDAQVVVFTSTPEPVRRDAAATVHVLRAPSGDLTMSFVLRRLREEFGVKTVLYEGGEQHLRALADEHVLDEVLVRVATSAEREELRTPPIGREEPGRWALQWIREVNGVALARYSAARPAP